MRKLLTIFALATLALAAVISAYGQQAGGGAPATGQTNTGITANRVIGEVTAIDQAAGRITVKADGGGDVTVMLDEKTVYLRTQPGATNLTGATKIAAADISVGDRVLALWKVAGDQKSVPARQVIVMTKADIAKKHESDRAEWQRRGISGTISALNPATKEITVQMRTREGNKPIVIAVGDNVQFRRYAADSVKFSDAKPSSFAELKVGDQIRALGEKNVDSTRFTPEEIVSGTFRQLVGTVTAVNAATGEVKINNQETKQPLTVVINKDSLVRRLSPMMAMMLARRAQGGGPGGPDGPGGPGMMRRQGDGPPPGAGNAPGAQRPQGGERPQGAGEGPMGGGRRMMGGGPGGGPPDVQEMLERLPQLDINELKTGDIILVQSTVGADPSRATAVALIAGIDAIINAMQAQGQGRQGGPGGVSTGLPAGALDIGIGLP